MQTNKNKTLNIILLVSIMIFFISLILFYNFSTSPSSSSSSSDNNLGSKIFKITDNLDKGNGNDVNSTVKKTIQNIKQEEVELTLECFKEIQTGFEEETAKIRKNIDTAIKLLEARQNKTEQSQTQLANEQPKIETNKKPDDKTNNPTNNNQPDIN